MIGQLTPFISREVIPITCTYLDPDSSDSEPGGMEDYWTDTLETRYPSGPGMKWVVYQSSQSHLTIVDTLDVMITINNDHFC